LGGYLDILEMPGGGKRRYTGEGGCDSVARETKQQIERKSSTFSAVRGIFSQPEKSRKGKRSGCYVGKK